MAISKIIKCFVMISGRTTGLLLHFAYNQQSMRWNNHFWKSRPLLNKSSSYLNIQRFINQSSQASIIQTHRHWSRSWWIHHMPTYCAKVLFPTVDPCQIFPKPSFSIARYMTRSSLSHRSIMNFPLGLCITKITVCMYFGNASHSQ